MSTPQKSHHNLPFPGDEYRFCRLVMVNSGNSAYLNLPLDESAAIVGDNNKGKTSGLNALKLFLLPEINFKDCESKFGFTSSGKAYTARESFEYYFPSSRSFLILEAKNRRNPFCIVLHQSPKEEFGYSRIAIPKPYAEIEHLFWNFGVEANEGLGAHPEDLALASIRDALIAMDGTPLTDRATIMEALYTRITPSKPNSRYCLMPLVQPATTTVMKSIKSILQLSFDIKGANRANLPQAFAHVIDSSIATDRGSVNIDLQRIQDERVKIQEDLAQINNIKNHQSDWKKFAKEYLSYADNCSKIGSSLGAIQSDIEEQIENYQPDLENIKERHKEACLAHSVLDSQQQQDKDKKRQLESDATSEERKVRTCEARITLAKNVIAREKPSIGTDGPLQVAEHLKTILKEEEENLAKLANMETTAAGLKELLAHLKRVNSEIDNISQMLRGESKTILDSMDNHSAAVLYSLNEGFAKASGALDRQDQGAVEEFAAHFDNQDGAMCLAGNTIPGIEFSKYDPGTHRVKQKMRLEAKRQEKTRINDRIRLFKDRLGPDGDQQTDSSDKIQATINEINEEIEAVTAYEVSIKDLKAAQAIINNIVIKIKDLTEKMDSREDQLLAARAAKETTYQDQQSMLDKFSDLKRATDRVNREKKLFPADVIRYMDSPSIAPIKLPDRLEDRLSFLSESVDQIKGERESMLSSFRLLVKSEIAAIDTGTPYQEGLNLREIHDAYELLRAEFENLRHRETEIEANIQNHNHQTGIEISQVGDMSKAIQRFEDKINATLGSIRISNLDSINIQIKTLPAFNSLKRDIENYASYSEKLRPDAFYQRLSDFCGKYLTKGANSRLDLAEIITEVGFVYSVGGEKKATSQSNGTTGMVNAVLLSILLKDMVPEDVVLTLPVVFDEVGSLDKCNLPELRRVVESNHFSLLVANPDVTSKILRHIGLYHDIYFHQITEGKITKNCRSIYHPAQLGLSSIDDEDLGPWTAEA